MDSEPRMPPRVQSELKTKGQIRFLHPGYSTPDTLLTLARSDCVNSNGTVVFGVHYETALLACQIIANNVFHSGYFTLDQSGLQRVNIPSHGLLTKKNHYFFIDGIDKFQSFPVFEIGNFPIKTWKMFGQLFFATILTIAILSSLWIFLRCDWSSYYPTTRDFHKCFDDRWFVIIPKQTSSGTRYVTHVLLSEAAEIWPDYHNIEIRCLSPDQGRNFLFARFAWTIIQRVRPFITAGFKRKVVRLNNENTDDTDEMEYLVMDIGGPQLQNLYSRCGSKSATPLKRKFHELSSGDSDSDMDFNNIWDMEFRKRRMSPTLAKDVQKELEASVADLITSQNLQEVDDD
ncbi:hypothetical protein GGI43DRAFT_383022 [Trichoderma evansii]